MLGHLGRYEILSPIGSGGMGEVYRARDRRLDRIVAIKVLKISSLSNPNARARFEREARAVALLDHPHICSLYDVDNFEGVEFLVMQYLEGETLAARLQSGPLPIADALKFGSQIAHAIAAAHARGVTHRDLKPSNVMITASGAMLLDFGLAKLGNDNTSARSDSTETDNLTREGTVLGTVRYMSPEALERRTIDARSDLFSFGAVLYEMITGSRAFDGDSDARVIASILSWNPRPLLELRPDAPVEVAALVETCLAKDPNERWQSAHDVAVQLSAIAGTRSATPAPISSATMRLYRAQPRWMAAAVVGTMSVAAGGLAYERWWTNAPPPPPHLVALPCRADDAGDQALCDGFTEALIGRMVRLTQSQPLQVTARLGGLLGTTTTAAEAGPANGATRVVEPRSSNKRITFTLVEDGRARPPFSIDPADLFEAEERAVLWLVRSLALELSPAEREESIGRGTANAAARLAFLRGRGHFVSASDTAGFDAAIGSLDEAVRIDPKYSLAHAALGMAWRGKYLRSPDDASAAHARQACSESIRLQPNLSLGHTCLGMLNSAARDLEAAAAELARAVEADPTNDEAIMLLGRTQEALRLVSDAERTFVAAIQSRPRYYYAHVWAANFYRRQSRYDDAARALSKAVSLVPAQGSLNAALAVPLMLTGHYQESLVAVQRAIDIAPTKDALVLQGMTLFRMRRFDAAAATIERARSAFTPDGTLLSGLARAYYWSGTVDGRSKAMALFREAVGFYQQDADNPAGRLPKADVHIALADCYAKLGRAEEAKAEIERAGLNLDATERPSDSHLLFFAALIYSQLGEPDTAIKWLERADYWGVPPAELRAWPELDTLRSNRAFQALIRPK